MIGLSVIDFKYALDTLPKYIWYDDVRCFLSITADIKGQWLIGYEDIECGHYPEPYALGPYEDFTDAVQAMHIRLKEEKP